MKSYFGSYIIQGNTEPIESTVLVFDSNLSIGYRNENGTNALINWHLTDIELNFDFAAQSTAIKNKKYPGSSLNIRGNDAYNFIKDQLEQNSFPWHKKRSGKEWIRNSLLFIALLAGLFFLYLLIVPWLSEQLAGKVSIKRERQIGDAVYQAMGMQGRENTAASFILNEFFTAVNVPTPYSIRISVVNNDIKNAFALPGGRIVVFSGLLEKIKSYPELAALLSHEFTHINNKHSTKRIFRQLGSKVFIGLLLGNFGTVTSVIVDQADDLKSLTYSRKLEKEADVEGLKVLMARKIDPRGFRDLFTHMKEEEKATRFPEFLKSHPDTDKRITYIQQAARSAQVADDPMLARIFQKLKTINYANNNNKHR